MNLQLLEKIFQNLEMTLTLDEAKEKATLFKICADNIYADFSNDYWIQISSEWDLNIYDGDMTLYKCSRTKQGFETDTSEGFKVYTYPVDFKLLSQVLDEFGNREYISSGVSMLSGGFAHADYDDYDEEWVYITLEWGVIDETENRVNTEHYKIPIDAFDGCLSVDKIIMEIQDS